MVFYQKSPLYNPQKTRKPKKNVRPPTRGTQTDCYGKFDPKATRTEKCELQFPHSILKFNNSSTGGDKGLHPTQKPVALMEYIIKTYSNPGDTVLDFTMGSGTTGVACQNLGRKFVGIELDPGYFQIAKYRILGLGEATLDEAQEPQQVSLLDFFGVDNG